MILLAILRAGDEAYGVAIAKEIETTGRRVLLGAVYAALERLERNGLVVSKVGEPDCHPRRPGQAVLSRHAAGTARREGHAQGAGLVLERGSATERERHMSEPRSPSPCCSVLSRRSARRRHPRRDRGPSPALAVAAGRGRRPPWSAIRDGSRRSQLRRCRCPSAGSGILAIAVLITYVAPGAWWFVGLGASAA